VEKGAALAGAPVGLGVILRVEVGTAVPAGLVAGFGLGAGAAVGPLVGGGIALGIGVGGVVGVAPGVGATPGVGAGGGVGVGLPGFALGCAAIAISRRATEPVQSRARTATATARLSNRTFTGDWADVARRVMTG